MGGVLTGVRLSVVLGVFILSLFSGGSFLRTSGQENESGSSTDQGKAPSVGWEDARVYDVPAGHRHWQGDPYYPH